MTKNRKRKTYFTCCCAWFYLFPCLSCDLCVCVLCLCACLYACKSLQHNTKVNLHKSKKKKTQYKTCSSSNNMLVHRWHIHLYTVRKGSACKNQNCQHLQKRVHTDTFSEDHNAKNLNMQQNTRKHKNTNILFSYKKQQKKKGGKSLTLKIIKSYCMPTKCNKYLESHL